MRPVPLTTTRRGFLRLSGSAAALATLARLPGAQALASTSAAPGASFFSASEREILTQVVERMVDTGEPDAPAVRETLALDTIDAFCASIDPVIVDPLPMLLRSVEWGPFLFDLNFTRFTRLSPEEQDASLRGWMTSRFLLRRLGFQALRNLAFVGYYSQEATWPLIGYKGPLLRGTRP